MTRILTQLDTRNIDNDKYVQLIAPFVFESDVLKALGGVYRVTVPAGFVMDFESVPWVRGSNKRGGTAHDYLCRIDSSPVVEKPVAAAVYFEVMEYCYDIDARRRMHQKIIDWGLRWFKWSVVYVAPRYFHKFPVMASAKEIAGIEGDPYVTLEKLDAAIVQSEQATDAIKDVPAGVEGKPEMVEASQKVTSDLKDTKANVIERGKND